jgi:phospholipid/cholesterol/gamma-HCH transport system substrate-binding protein
MQRNIKREFNLGVLFIVAVIFLAFVTVTVSRWELFAKRRYVKVIFDNVLGLKKGDSVRVSGVAMGQVDRLKYMTDTRVRVVLKLEDPITIWDDCKIGVAESSMLGGYYISIDPGTPGHPEVNIKEPLPGHVIKPGMTAISDFIEKNQDEVRELLSGAISIIKDASAGKGTLGMLIKDDSLYNNLNDSTDSMKRLLKNAEDGKGTIGRLLQEDQLYKDADDVIKSLKDSADSLNRTLKHIEEGKGPIGKAIYDEELSRQISDAGNSVNKLLDPVIKTKVYAGAEGKYYLDSKSTLSDLYIRIEPRESRYFLIGASFLSFDKDQNIVDFEDKLNDKDQTFVKVNLLTAYKLFDDRLTARIGLLEGKFGGGIDWELPFTGSLVSQLMFTLEGRDAYNSVDKENIDENLDAGMVRAYLTVKLGKHFKVFAGGSRLFDDDPELMGGFCFEYVDEDIKNFVTLIGLSR